MDVLAVHVMCSGSPQPGRKQRASADKPGTLISSSTLPRHSLHACVAPHIPQVGAISARSSKLAAGCRRASASPWYIAESGYAGDDELAGVEDVLSTLNRLAHSSDTACAVKGVIQSELRQPAAENQVGRGWIGLLFHKTCRR